MSQQTRSCSVKDCDFVNPSGNEADLNYHISSAHPEEWKKKNEKIQKEAKTHMKKTYGNDYIRKTAQKEPRKRR